MTEKSEPENKPSAFSKDPKTWTVEDANEIIEHLKKWYEREKGMDRRKKKKTGE